MRAKDYGDVENAQIAHEQHAGGDRLHGELQIRAGGKKIVIHAEQEDQRGGRENG